MVIGDTIGTVQKNRTPSNHTVKGSGVASGGERERRIAELEAENRRLAQELARSEQERQAIIDQYERVLAARTNPTPDCDDRGTLGGVLRLLK